MNSPLDNKTSLSRNVPNPVDERLRTIANARKLRLILASVGRKKEQGLALTPDEEELMAELYRIRTVRERNKVTVDRTTGAVTFTKTIDTEPMLQVIADYDQLLDKHQRKALDKQPIGSLDEVTVANWAKEWGVKPYTREFNGLAAKRILHDRDFYKFKIGG